MFEDFDGDELLCFIPGLNSEEQEKIDQETLQNLQGRSEDDKYADLPIVLRP